MTTRKATKRKSACQQSTYDSVRNKPINRQAGFISMSEARQIAELVFSGIALSG